MSCTICFLRHTRCSAGCSERYAGPISRARISAGCAPALSQHAALAALVGPQDAVAEMCAAYRRRRDLAVELLEPHGLCRYRPGGAFYMLVDLPGDVPDTYDFAKRLLQERDVAVAPGETFGASGAGRVRISTATSDELLREGIERLIDFAVATG